MDYIKEAKVYKLSDPDTKINATTLWEKQPVMVMVVRRPGCNLCRAQCMHLLTFKDELDRRNIKFIAISHQEDSAKEFAEMFLKSDEIYIDSNKSFYRALGYADA